MSLYDLTGRKVKDLLNGNIDAGYHSLELNATDLPSGMYFYSIDVNGHGGTNSFSSTKKLVLMK